MELPYKRVALPTRLALLFTASLIACVEGPTARQTAGGRLAIAPAFSRDAAQIAGSLGAFGVQYDRVRIIVVRPVADTVYDKTLTFQPGQADLTVNVTVQARNAGEVFNVSLEYGDATTVFFAGTARVASTLAEDPAPAPTTIHVEYVGPGVTVTRLTISTRPASISTTTTLPLAAQGFDAGGNLVPNVPIEWSVSDPALGSITAGATTALQPTGRRGTIAVTARAPNGVTDQASIVLIPPPAALVLLSGGGQSGPVGGALPAPIVIEVRASDGLPVSGAAVSFTAPAGGTASPATATSDASGRVSTSLTLGRTVGAQTFTATSGTLSVGIPATATAGAAAAIAVVSGSVQSDTLRKTLAAPLVVRVTDQFGNPVAGATVAWARTGTGSLGAASSVTGPDGTTSVSYTLGTVVGSETITASTAGVATPATFTVSALAAAPSAIAVVSGDGQAAPVNGLLASLLVVRVTDGGGFPVSGVVVNWTATNATLGAISTTTDATGQASTTLRVGAVLGSATATATITVGTGTRTASFIAGVVAGAPAALEFRAQPSNAAVGVAIAPAVQVALVDAFGNQTSSTAAVTVALSGGTAGAVLSGTMTKNAVAGLATFNDLAVDRAGTGFRLSATSSAGQALSGTFNVTAGGPALVIKLAGDNQIAVAGTTLPAAPSVRVVNASNVPLAGIAVTFTPLAASGAVTGGTVNTDANGIATVGSWTLGPNAGPQALSATAGTVTNTFNATATGSTTPGVILTVGALGSAPTATVAAGQDITIPITLDLTNRGSADIASIAVTVTWDPARFTFKSQTGGGWVDSNGGAASLTVNSSNTAGGSIQIAGFTTASTLTSFVLSNIVLTANPTGTPIPVNVGASISAAGNVAGAAISVGVRALVVTVTP